MHTGKTPNWYDCFMPFSYDTMTYPYICYSLQIIRVTNVSKLKRFNICGIRKDDQTAEYSMTFTYIRLFI